MMPSDRKADRPNTKKSRNSFRLALFFLLLLLLLLLWQRCSAPTILEPEERAVESVAPLSFEESSSEEASSEAVEEKLSSSIPSIAKSSSAQKLSSEKISEEALSELPLDTIPPELFFDPPEGLYFGKVEVVALCEESRCRTWLAVGQKEPTSADWGETRQTLQPPGGVIWAVAEDSAGNRSPVERREYLVQSGSPQCGAHAVPVEWKGGGFCIDQYEWPNEPGALPLGAVSQQAAVDSCAAHGKRLCSIEEWQRACRGPKQSAYPYGERYQQRSCYTAEAGKGRSGRKANCRSWYGAYDMSGNLWEWTSTPHAGRTDRFEVAGGSWGAGDRSSCRDTKWSFFPQNEYPIIGFRCCAPLGSREAR